MPLAGQHIADAVGVHERSPDDESPELLNHSVPRWTGSGSLDEIPEPAKFLFDRAYLVEQHLTTVHASASLRANLLHRFVHSENVIGNRPNHPQKQQAQSAQKQRT